MNRLKGEILRETVDEAEDEEMQQYGASLTL
jgi:hypothetical protein